MNKEDKILIGLVIATIVFIVSVVCLVTYSEYKTKKDHDQWLIDYKCKFISKKEIMKSESCGKYCARLVVEKTYICAYGLQTYEE